MTAPERVYTAMSGGMPDRVPAIPKITVDCATRILGVDMLEVLRDPFLALKVILDLALATGVDGIRQFHFPARRVQADGNRVLEFDASGRAIGEVDMMGGLATHLYETSWLRLEDPLHTAYLQYYVTPEPGVTDVAGAKRIAVPPKALYEELGWGDRQRAILELAGERVAVIGDCNTATLSFCIYFRQYQNCLFDLVDDPALIHALMEKGAEFAVERGKFNIDLGLRVLRLNDSAGNISVISPRHWREFVFPHMRDVCAELHRYHPGVCIYCHICGNVLPIVEDLVKAGLDCIAPLDPLGGFTCAQVRQACGGRVALMGGVNAISFAAGTPESIMEESRRCIEGAGRRGYILGSGCMVPPGTRKENLQALAEAARVYGSAPAPASA
jgi:hypothetical protein